MGFYIGNAELSSNKVTIIAEAGVNHLGSLELAEKLIKAAAESGADIIKFQTYKANDLTIKSAPRFWSWDGESSKDGSQHDSYSQLDSFGEEQYIELSKLCKKYEIEFMSTPFSTEAAEMLVRVGVKGFKLASCDITNIPFLKEIAKHGLPMLLSTGASTLVEIHDAVNAIHKVNSNIDLCIMQCTLCYPTEYKDAHLNALLDIKKEFPEFLLGFSDHTLGYHVPLASISLGVRVIEKHFTVDKNLPKSADHWLSVDPDELNKLCVYSQDIMDSLGENKKQKLSCEDKTHAYARRSVVTNVRILSGATIKSSDVSCKRPGTGLAPVYLDKIIGSIAARDVEADSVIVEEDIKWIT